MSSTKGKHRRPALADVAPSDAASRLLVAAHAGDAATVHRIATEAHNALSPSGTADLVQMLAWAAGCFSRRLPSGEAAQIHSELRAASALVSMHRQGVMRS